MESRGNVPCQGTSISTWYSRLCGCFFEVPSAAAGLVRFGNVASGIVHITGHLRTVEWRATGTDMAETLFLYREDGRSLPAMHPDRVLLDRVLPGDKGKLTCCLLRSYDDKALILVLELVSLSITYQRVGLIPAYYGTDAWTVRSKATMDREEIDPWFLEAERSTFEII